MSNKHDRIGIAKRNSAKKRRDGTKKKRLGFSIMALVLDPRLASLGQFFLLCAMFTNGQLAAPNATRLGFGFTQYWPSLVQPWPSFGQPWPALASIGQHWQAWSLLLLLLLLVLLFVCVCLCVCFCFLFFILFYL